ncbi:hypothetical protein O59_002687 [Cellvibrio sp. BR]|nr:hypothetical protein O59_002687 [Cellvibrio sp. BR]
MGHLKKNGAIGQAKTYTWLRMAGYWEGSCAHQILQGWSILAVIGNLKTGNGG